MPITPIKQDLLNLVLVRQQNFLNCEPRVLQMLKTMLSSIVKRYMRDPEKTYFGLLNTALRYLDDILNINNVYFDNMISQIYPSELQLNKANTSDTEATF